MRCRNTYTAQHANRKSVESNDENLNVNDVRLAMYACYITCTHVLNSTNRWKLLVYSLLFLQRDKNDRVRMMQHRHQVKT